MSLATLSRKPASHQTLSGQTRAQAVTTVNFTRFKPSGVSCSNPQWPVLHTATTRSLEPPLHPALGLGLKPDSQRDGGFPSPSFASQCQHTCLELLLIPTLEEDTHKKRVHCWTSPLSEANFAYCSNFVWPRYGVGVLYSTFML